ncbi:MAG: RND family efflux transporter MFP subunit [Spirochaetes bacterium]|nr:MAG: RND family efflux transporter MFP subunit [Spirochaetota bacterium]
MKSVVPRSLPQIIITLVIVAMGLSIGAKQLGISFKRPAAGTPAIARSQGGANGPEGGGSPGGRPAAVGQPQVGQPGGAGRSIAVRAAAVRSGDILNYIKIHGDVVADNEIKIYPSMAGRVVARQVGVGDKVSPGSAIALVDPSRIGQTFNHHTVESPVSGTVLSVPVHEGDTVGTNTVIATVGNLSRIRVNTAVPELHITNLGIGTFAEIRFDSLPGAVFGARIAEMDPVVDSMTRTLEIKLTLDRTDRRVLVGMFATVKLVTESRKNVLVVPRSAVVLGSGDTYVFVINQKGRVERRIVWLGLEGEDSFEVLKGLSVDERVVTEGKNSVQEGLAVRIIDGAIPGVAQ